MKIAIRGDTQDSERILIDVESENDTPKTVAQAYKKIIAELERKE